MWHCVTAEHSQEGSFSKESQSEGYGYSTHETRYENM